MSGELERSGFPKLASSESLSSGAPDTVRCAPDSPMNYSGAPLSFPEAEEFGLEFPGAPNSPVRQTRAAFDYPLLSMLNPFLGLFIG
jgi:hypothetical protein